MAFLNLSEYELPLEHLLVLLLFGGVYIVQKNIDNQPTTWKDLNMYRDNNFPLLTIVLNCFKNLNNLNKATTLFMLTTKSSNLICIIVT